MTQETIAAGETTEHHEFAFTGSGNEFAGIWFKNVLLTILTLGIYSAWASVRTRRYLYGNTWLMGSSFGYHASPITILKGRLLIFAALVTYMIAEAFASPLAAALAIVVVVLFPLLAQRALRFRRVNSSWRGVRFDFTGTRGDAVIVFLLLPLVTGITFGLLYPYMRYCQQQYIIDNSRFGESRGEMRTGPGPFYGIYMKVVALAVGMMIAAAVLLTSLMGAIEWGAGFESMAALPVFAAMLLVPYILYTVARTLVLNKVWNSTVVDGGRVRFESRLSAARMCWISIINLLLIVVTLGLYTPWARIRMMRYRVACMQAVAREEDVDQLVAVAERKQASAIGDEAVEWVGPEVGAL